MRIEMAELVGLVQKSFKNAIENPDIARWKACSIVAGCAAVRLAAEGELYMAASMEGVAEEARRQALSMQPKRYAA